MAKCKTCGAPVNLVPDGDPKYIAPPSPPTKADIRAEVIEELVEKAEENDGAFEAWYVRDFKPSASGQDPKPPLNLKLADWLRSQLSQGEGK